MMTNVISFPGLGGISFDINRVAFTIFGKEVYWYAIIILAGFLSGLAFAYNTCEKRGVKKEYVFDVAFWGLIIGIICARLYYVIFDGESISGDFINIFRIWNGGLAIYGGIIGAVGTVIVYSKIHKLQMMKLFDVCTPGLIIGQIIGRWGNFVNAEVFGRETNLPWRMSINGGAGVHPMFLYESLWNFIGFLIILKFRDKKKADGQVFYFYIIWYGIGRFFLESMRQPQYILWLIPDVLGISQLVALIAVAVGMVAIVYNNKKGM